MKGGLGDWPVNKSSSVTRVPGVAGAQDFDSEDFFGGTLSGLKAWGLTLNPISPKP